MNIEEFNEKFANNKQSDKIEIKCDHEECLNPVKSIGMGAAKRNILKNGGKKFICGNCDKRFNNPMNKTRQGRNNLGIIDVICPNCNKIRQMNGNCYFGELTVPYKQICKSCAQIGKIISSEQRKKISQTLSGRKLTDEHKENISQYMLNNPEGIARTKILLENQCTTGMLGKTTSEETKQKQSLAMKGRKYSDKHKINISKGRKKMLEETGGFSEEHRENLRKAAEEQYKNGFNPNTHHHSGWHKSNKAGIVFHRSSYEKKAFIKLDNMENVEKYEVETVRIPYFNPITQNESIFIVDILIQFKNGSKMLVEIKPQCWLDNLKNNAKIKALNEWCEKEKISYEIWDEYFLFGKENTDKKIRLFIEWMLKNDGSLPPE